MELIGNVLFEVMVMTRCWLWFCTILLLFGIPVQLEAEESQNVVITCSSQIQPQTGKLLMSAKLTKEGKSVLVKGRWEYQDQENRTETKDQSMTFSVVDQGTRPGTLETIWKFSGIVYGKPYYSEKKCEFRRIGLETIAVQTGEEIQIDAKILGVDQLQGKWNVTLLDEKGKVMEEKSETSNRSNFSYRFANVTQKVKGKIQFIGKIENQRRILEMEFVPETKSKTTVAKVESTSKDVQKASATTTKSNIGELENRTGSIPLGALVFILFTVAVFGWLQWRKMKKVN